MFVRYIVEGQAEVDIMTVIGELSPDTTRDIIDESESPPGFCRMRVPHSIDDVVNYYTTEQEVILADYRKKLEYEKLFKPDSGYISSRDIKESFKKLLETPVFHPYPAVEYPESENSQAAGLDLLGPSVEAGYNGRVIFNLLAKFVLKGKPGKPALVPPPKCEVPIAVDLVLCVKLSEWPVLGQ